MDTDEPKKIEKKINDILNEYLTANNHFIQLIGHLVNAVDELKKS